MRISGFQKLTLLDYPGKVAAIIFTQGCNYNCGFCHNSNLIKLDYNDLILVEDILDYLEKRKNILDGVVITGGEPTIQKDLIDFVKKIKNIGLLVKLDTNGNNPIMLKKIIDEKIVDYIAMDIKTKFDEYEKIVNKKINIELVKESINLIKNSGIDHEFRTTIMKEYHTINILKDICKYLGKKEKYFLQNFKQSEFVLENNLTSFSNDELKLINDTLKVNYPNVIVRGI